MRKSRSGNRSYDDWDYEGFCADVEVFVSPRTRISALLGPDGHPLEVGYEKPKLGFDLRPNRPRKPSQ